MGLGYLWDKGAGCSEVWRKMIGGEKDDWSQERGEIIGVLCRCI